MGGWDFGMSDDEEEAYEANVAVASAASASNVGGDSVASSSPGKTRSAAKKHPPIITPESFAKSLLKQAEKAVDKYKSVPAFTKDEFKSIKAKLKVMTSSIERAVPTRLQSTMNFFHDGKSRLELVDQMLLIPGIRDGYKVLMNIIVIIIDCAAYLDIELFGFRATGTTKGVQQLLRKYFCHRHVFIVFLICRGLLFLRCRTVLDRTKRR